jgi:fructose-1,6-bisphosphatase/inositol monophosphatase family enzyme
VYLETATPEFAFLGEEEGGGTLDQTTDYVWSLDLIDGASNFAHGIPLCATQLALVHRGEPIVAVIPAPFLEFRYHATGLGKRPHAPAEFGLKDQVVLGFRRPDQEIAPQASQTLHSGSPFDDTARTRSGRSRRSQGSSHQSRATIWGGIVVRQQALDRARGTLTTSTSIAPTTTISPSPPSPGASHLEELRAFEYHD